MNFSVFLRFLRGRSESVALICGLAILIMFGVFALFAEKIAPYDPNSISAQLRAAPSSEHLMGTDKLGRDIFSRVVFGTRCSMMVASLAVLVAMMVGTTLGIISGYLSTGRLGLLDRMVSIIMDTLYSFPLFILAALLAAMLGRSIINLAIAVATVSIPTYFRVIRSISLSVKKYPFIEAEKAIGASTRVILFRHILPYCIPSIVVLMSMGIADSILCIGGLGFLGLGVPPPTPEWGSDLEFGHQLVLSGVWWPAIFPGLMIFLASFSFNIIGESLDLIFKKKPKALAEV